MGNVVDAPAQLSHFTGIRVLPLRGGETWQQLMDCKPENLIEVPGAIDNSIAARACINPMVAKKMLHYYPVTNKRVLLTGAGSVCSGLLGRWALPGGAKQVSGIFRSPQRILRLKAAGIEPASLGNDEQFRCVAEEADITFDCVEGALGSLLLRSMRNGGLFVGYGALSGEGVRLDARRNLPAFPPA